MKFGVISDFSILSGTGLLIQNYEIRVGNLNTKRAIMDQRDLNKALILLSEKGIPGEVYNISSEYIYEMREIFSIIEKKIGKELTPVVDKALLRPTDEKIIVGNITKLQRYTGWKQSITIEQTVADMIEYWKKKIL